MNAILRQELRDALRNRWLVGYAIALAALGLVAAWAGLRSSEGMALATYGRTAATVTNLCLFLSPLASLVLGASTIAGERDRATLDYLLAQPIERRDLLLGKYLALRSRSPAPPCSASRPPQSWSPPAPVGARSPTS